VARLVGNQVRRVTTEVADLATAAEPYPFEAHRAAALRALGRVVHRVHDAASLEDDQRSASSRR
jgi:hypothetical protein